MLTTRKDHALIHYFSSIKKQNQFKSIMKLGSKALVKEQFPRPDPLKEGLIWSNHKKRKSYIVKKCYKCFKLHWVRKDDKVVRLCKSCSIKLFINKNNSHKLNKEVK